MTITEKGVIAAIVRDGDYLVFKADGDGLSVEYSPDAPTGAPVVGAFSAHKGKLKYFNAAEAAEILQNYTVGAEEHLAAEIDAAVCHKEKSLTDKVVEALKTYADAGYARTVEKPRWDGKLTDFHKEVLYPALGLPYSSNIIRAMQRASDRIPGVVVDKMDGEVFVTIDWPEVSQ